MPAVGLSIETNTALARGSARPVGRAEELDKAVYLPRLNFLPEQQGYMVNSATSVDAQATRGGLPRARRDKSGSSVLIDAQWLLNRSEYKEFVSFYDRFYHTDFRMFLLVSTYELTEHDVRFVPETFTLSQQDGDSYTVTARLEVKLLNADEAYDLGLVAIYGAYQEGSFALMDALAVFANTTLEANL